MCECALWEIARAGKGLEVGLCGREECGRES